jgi:hypothetical protein
MINHPQVETIKPPFFWYCLTKWWGVQYEQTNQVDVWRDEWGHESFIHPV